MKLIIIQSTDNSLLLNSDFFFHKTQAIIDSKLEICSYTIMDMLQVPLLIIFMTILTVATIINDSNVQENKEILDKSNIQQIDRLFYEIEIEDDPYNNIFVKMMINYNQQTESNILYLINGLIGNSQIQSIYLIIININYNPMKKYLKTYNLQIKMKMNLTDPYLSNQLNYIILTHLILIKCK